MYSSIIINVNISFSPLSKAEVFDQLEILGFARSSGNFSHTLISFLNTTRSPIIGQVS
jgi:hypothetical protein